MRKKLFGFMQGRFDIFWCVAILFLLLTAVPSSGSFTTATAGPTTVKVLVIGGGGGGGNDIGQGWGCGGGGGGGYQYDAAHEVTPQAYTVTVGNGGAANINGENSVFDIITATGGGHGGNNHTNGANGGCGGGAGGGNTNTFGGTGSQGAKGGDNAAYGGGGGGGGGATSAGSNAVNNGNGVSGGAGTSNSISGSPVTYAGGGGGGASAGAVGPGGAGGGGAGFGGNNTYAVAGTANTGGGGGGGGASLYLITSGGGADGGSGIVIIRYVTADFGACTGGTKTTDGADTVHTFTTSGTFTVVALSAPTVTTSSATNVTSNSVTLNGTVNANGQSTTAWFNYGITSGSYTGTSTTQSVSGSSDTTVSIDISGLSSSTTYYYRIAAQSSAGTSYGSELSFTTPAVPTPTPSPTPTPTPPDITAPSGSISINSDASYTNSTAVTLNLSATDAVGVVGYYVSTSSSTPMASVSGWNSVTSTISYTGSVSYTLTSGDETKTVYAWYKDAAGNVSSSSSDSIILDTTAPIVTITSPTSGDAYTTTSSPLSLSGSASDSTSGVSAVIWSNNKGGSGDASGTTYWSVSSVSLSSGDNVITVTAKDNAGNTFTDTITVTYTGLAPTVQTGSAKNVTSTSEILTGTVNAKGQSTTAWFEYGTVKGTYGNKSSTQSVSGSTDTTVSIGISGLSSGTNYYYRIAAQNSAGTSYGSEASFTTKTVPPTPTPTATPKPTPTSTASPVPTLPPKPTPPPFPTPKVSPSPVQGGIVFGIVNDQDDNAFNGVTVTITVVGENGRSPLQNSTSTDDNGYYEFRGLSQGDYTLTYEKEGYQTQTQDISLKEGELKDLGTVTMEQVVKGKISGYVVNIKGDPIESVQLRLKGIKTKVSNTTSSDADGFFEFAELDADTYVIFAKKKRYRKTQQRVTLGDGESQEIEIEMKKTSKRVIEMMEDGQ